MPPRSHLKSGTKDNQRYNFHMNNRIYKITGGILLAVILLFAVGFRWGHPKDGLSNALGSANSGIVVYHKGSSISVGSKVISGVSAPAKGPVIAVVTAVSGDNVEIQTGKKLIRVKKTEISGKLLVVVPFVGAVLSIVGL
jgi:hypothetical protein